MSVKLTIMQLDGMSQQAGFESYSTMLYELYVVRRMGLTEIAARCSITSQRVRKHLTKFGIPIRGKGGPNNVKVVVTDDLLREIARDGVPAVAERLGVNSIRLYTQLKALSEDVWKEVLK